MKKLFPYLLGALLLGAGYGIAAELSDLAPVDASNTFSAANAGFPENMAPSAVNNAARALEGMLARYLADSASTLTVNTTSNTTYAVTANQTISALEDGMVFLVEMTPTNAASATLNISNTGAKSLRSSGDPLTDLDAGSFADGSRILISYDSTNDVWQMLSAVVGSSTELSQDTTPVLGGNLDLSTFTIAGMVTGTDIQVDLSPPTAGEVTAGTSTTEKVWTPKLIAAAVEAHKAADVQLFTASGTWLKPVTASAILIEAWGGGGSGSRVSSGVGAAGGGGGGYVWLIMDAFAVDASETVTVGAGGAAVTGDSTDGNAGGNSSFGTTPFITAFGGGGAGSGGSGGGGGGGATSVSVGASSSNDSGANAGTFGGAGASVNNDGTANYFGGGGGGKEGDGGAAALGGGGGGGGSNGTTAGIGGNTLYGGGGGGGGEDSGGTAGGTSTFGGNGGGGGAGVAGTAGSVPGGGGGGAGSANNSGAGGSGQVRVISF